MPRHVRFFSRSLLFASGLALSATLGLAMILGCSGGPGGGPGGDAGEGPGHRAQYLALTPDQELSLGRQAYREVLQKYRGHIVENGKAADTVREVGKKIVAAAQIKPLQKEINLHFDENKMEWQFTLIDDRQANAFCLPGGKVAVFTGLFNVVANDDELAAVMGHEIGHALAHHASERIYREHELTQALDAADGNSLDRMNARDRNQLIGLMAAGAGGSLQAAGSGFSSLAYERAQESEADHIGLFLMTFAGYKPEACITLWERMAERAGHSNMPEILSDHPSDARRIKQMQEWVPEAEAGLKAYKEGRIAQ